MQPCRCHEQCRSIQWYKLRIALRSYRSGTYFKDRPSSLGGGGLRMSGLLTLVVAIICKGSVPDALLMECAYMMCSSLGKLRGQHHHCSFNP